MAEDVQRSQFTFYESFARAGVRIRKKTDRCAFYDALIEYALYGVLPDLESLPDVVALAFELVRPNLDASRRKAGGGAVKKTDKIPER